MTDKALARGLGFLTAAAMALTQAPVGFVRDEGYYFTAAQNAEAWLRLLLHSPLQAVAQTERYWSYNFEHPGLTKLLFASSHLLFTTWLRILPDALAWRLPAFAFAGLLSYWLCLLGLSRESPSRQSQSSTGISPASTFPSARCGPASASHGCALPVPASPRPTASRSQ